MNTEVRARVEALLAGALWCQREENAWDLGTMTKEDYLPFTDDPAVVDDFVELIKGERTTARKELAKELKQANMRSGGVVEAYTAMDRIVDRELYQ
jgi:hypothetical protein